MTDLPDGFRMCATDGCTNAFKPRTVQRFCRSCSTERDRARKRQWARDNLSDVDFKQRRIQQTERRNAMRERGANINAETPTRRKFRPGLKWQIETNVPFSYAGSKNHIWSMAGTHVYSREESKQYRATIAETVALAIANANVDVVRGRLWVGLFVQMPDNRGDAHNMVDLVMDAIEDATGIDDRYYSISGVDWEITKHDPRLFITVGQESTHHTKVCSSCGRFLPLTDFSSNRSAKDGLSRNCRQCRKGRNR